MNARPIPTRTQMFWRGTTRACPPCGRRRLTRRWLVMPEHCPQCGFKFERAPGHNVGAIGVSTVVTFGLLIITAVVGVAVTFPDVPFLPIAAISVAVAIIVPIAIHPTAKLFWIALDLTLDPLRPDEAPGLGIERREDLEDHR